MNERIRELAEQATTIVEMVGPQGYASSYAKFDKEKFAQLIVEECAQVAYHYTDGSENYQHYNDIGWDCLPGHLFHHIREHFGIN